MKKCTYCGKEYPQEFERCLNDGEILLDEGLPPSSSDTTPEVAKSPSTVALTDRQLCIFEIVLVCVIAFGGDILSSSHSLFIKNSGGSVSSGSGEFGWVFNCFKEISALGLVWYVLQRRGKSFVDLGLTWAKKDIGWSILLNIGGSFAFYAVYAAIYFSGLTETNRNSASAYVGHVLFGGGIFFTTMLFQFLNPFFEELIVRAYVMTEVKRLTNSATKAIIISTLLQTSYHFYQGVPMAFSLGAVFLIFSIYYAKTNRIAPIILAHLYADVLGTLWHFRR